jgi:pimeloyl-ACP methyl ester carboxylesterase
MATFVLVHGAWHGAWCWQRVVLLLNRAGHDVFAPTLTGLCERSHLLTPAVDLDTHILDIVNELKWQELKDVVIVGHSYGGMVISGVAEKMEKAIASFVMLDAFMPENGQSVVDIWPAAMRDGLLAAERGGATTVPPRAAEAFKVNEKDRAWVDAQCRPRRSDVSCKIDAQRRVPAHWRLASRSPISMPAWPARGRRGGAPARSRAATTSCLICPNGLRKYCRKPPEHAAAGRPIEAGTVGIISHKCMSHWSGVSIKTAISPLGLGRVKTKSDLVVTPSGRQIFAFFCSPRDRRAQNSGCGYTA